MINNIIYSIKEVKKLFHKNEHKYSYTNADDKNEVFE